MTYTAYVYQGWDAGNGGKTLDDFVGHPVALRAGLTRAEVAALRLYTTDIHELLDADLRQICATYHKVGGKGLFRFRHCIRWSLLRNCRNGLGRRAPNAGSGGWALGGEGGGGEKHQRAAILTRYVTIVTVWEKHQTTASLLMTWQDRYPEADCATLPIRSH